MMRRQSRSAPVVGLLDRQTTDHPVTWVVGAPDTGALEHAVRIRAEDLRDAQRQSARVRAGSSTPPLVLLDIEVLVDISADAARGHLPDSSDIADDPPISSTSYVGTVTGLCGLIRDLHALGIADGVLLIPLSPDPTVELVKSSLPLFFTPS
ncbi:hypothetical protein OG225_00780 [Nocardia sp. NBC_01377]